MSTKRRGSAPVPSATLELSATPGHLIRRAQRVHGALWARHVGSEPTGPQFAVLSSIARRPGLDQTTVGALAALDKSTTVDIVRRLVRDGWICVEPDPGDRRRKQLQLTRPARAALRTLTGVVGVVQSALLAPLAVDRRHELVRHLAVLAYEGHPPDVADPDGGLGLELAATPGHLIRRAQHAYTLRWTNRFRGAMTGPQYAVLCALAARQPADQATVGEAAALDKSSVAEVVDRLVGRGLVTVLADPADRRRKVLRFSTAGTEALPDLTAAAAAVQTELMDLLPAAVRPGFLDALAVIAYQDVRFPDS